MFSWLKRKPQEEEPLVPHGLIWQATDDPMHPTAPDINPSVSPKDPNSQIPDSLPAAKMPAHRVEPPKQPVHIGNLAPELEEAPGSLPWPSLNAKGSIRKRPLSVDESSFWRKPGNQKPVTPAEDANSISDIAPVRSAVSDGPADRNTINRFVADCKQELRSAWLQVNHATAELFANARHAYLTWEVKKTLGHARQDAEARIARIRVNVSNAGQDTAESRRKLSAVMAAAFARSRSAASILQQRSVAGLRASERLAQRVSAYRVKIRIPASAKIAPAKLPPLFGSINDAKIKTRLALRQNSRLAASMAMAALSAVLTLGLILLVSRYEPAANAGANSMTTPQPEPISGAHTLPRQRHQAQSVKSHKPGPASADRTVSAKPSAVVSTSLHADVKPAQSTAVTARRPHRNQDEDYVARDTYVYYGAKGKQSR